ncbi:MAG: neutral/alkaline non-lysosomal ceramidase N-terminal domain-containing protein, partial [Acidobacteria bacterium]|nr:neutral/alkaline non-lysosomal ceramidase N-terminal domain-containing protein [Acidobacteriota bacterium]
MMLLLLLALFCALPITAQTTWKAGVAKVKITPAESIWLAGYGARTKPSEGVLQDIYAKALAIQDAQGNTSVLVTADLLGFNRQMSDAIAEGVRKKYGLSRDRLVLNASHTHSAPVT